MNIIDLDGHSQNWHLTGHISKGRIHNKSSYHLQARTLLAENFPTLQILEEVSIPLRKGETLYMDFYLPLIKKCVEVHGEQHYKFIPFYHGTKMNYLKSLKRDQEKIDWCNINGINYVSLPYNENLDQWKIRINND